MGEQKMTTHYSGSETRKTTYDMTFDFGRERRKIQAKENSKRRYGEVRQNR